MLPGCFQCGAKHRFEGGGWGTAVLPRGGGGGGGRFQCGVKHRSQVHLPIVRSLASFGQFDVPLFRQTAPPT